MPLHSTAPPMSPQLMQKSRSSDSTVAVQPSDESLKSPTSVMAFRASNSPSGQRALFAESPRSDATSTDISSPSQRFVFEDDSNDEEDDLGMTFLHPEASPSRPASIFLPRGPATIQDSNLAQMLTIRRSNAFEED